MGEMVSVCPDSSVIKVSTTESGAVVSEILTVAFEIGISPKEEVTFIVRFPKKESPEGGGVSACFKFDIKIPCICF